MEKEIKVYEPIIPHIDLEFCRRAVKKIPSEKKLVVKFICKLHIEKTRFNEKNLRINPITFKKYNAVVQDDGRFIVTAHCTCDENEVYDEVKCFRIAETRAKMKAYSLAKEVCNEIYDDYARMECTLSNSIDRFERLTEQSINHINNLRNA